MTEALLFVSVGSLLSVGVAALIIATLTLQNARRYVELAEDHMKYLREEQARLVAFVQQERQSLKEELAHEREQRLEAQRRAEWASRESAPLRQKVLVEGFEGEQHPGTSQERQAWEWELRARRDIEHRIDELKREFEKLREDQQEPKAESAPPFSKATIDEVREPAPPRQANPPKASSPPPEDNKPSLAVWHPHPDDDVDPGRTSTRPLLGDPPTEMFRRHYDKYLENYEGYVKLAGRIYRMRDNAEVPPGSLAEREWEARVRRVIDGIERTTARLDLLEEYNPELATDDRISRRASIARSHAELQRSTR